VPNSRPPRGAAPASLQAIIFDFDGVIANSEPLHLRAFQDTLAEAGMLLTSADYYARYLGFDDVGLFEAVGRDLGQPMDEGRVRDLVDRKAARMRELLESGSVLFPGAADFIRQSAVRVPVAVASGALRPEIEAILGAAKLLSLFPVIVAAGDTPRSKPSPEPYRLAFRRLSEGNGGGLDPARCVAIEDSRWGLQSARGAGLRSVGVTTSYPAAELGDADLVVGGLGDLTIEALDELCSQPA